jgi:hypothetical protein
MCESVTHKIYLSFFTLNPINSFNIQQQYSRVGQVLNSLDNAIPSEVPEIDDDSDTTVLFQKS